MTDHALIVFTDHFPFAVGDEFFEQEIGILAKEFSKVIVIPVLEYNGATQTRTLPENVETRLLPKSMERSWKINACKWILPLLLRHREMIETWPWQNFMRFVIDARFATTALEFSHLLKRVITKEELNHFRSITFYSYWFYTGAAVACLWKTRHLRELSVSVFSRAHAYDVDEDDTAFGYLPGRPFLLKHANQVWPISEYAFNQLARHCPKEKAKLAIRRLGVPAMETCFDSRGELLRIVSCSHMAPYKRVDLLVDTIAELGERGIPVKWTHIGEFQAERLERMRNYAATKIRNVDWEMLGRLDNQQVHELYASETFDVFVNTSESEGVPVSVMEAFAASIPVVATAAGGTEEIVHDSKNGFIVPVQTTPQQIADRILELHSLTDESYFQMRNHAHETWQNLANAEKQYLDLAKYISQH